MSLQERDDREREQRLKERKNRTEEKREAEIRLGAAGTVDAMFERPGDMVLKERYLLHDCVLEVLSDAFDAGYSARQEEEEDEENERNNDGGRETAFERGCRHRQEQASWLTPNQREALQLVGVYTSGTFILQALDGPAHAFRRASILAALTSASVPKSKAGANALKDALYAFSKPEGETPSARELDFRRWAKAQIEEAVTA